MVLQPKFLLSKLTCQCRQRRRLLAKPRPVCQPAAMRAQSSASRLQSLPLDLPQLCSRADFSWETTLPEGEHLHLGAAARRMFKTLNRQLLAPNVASCRHR